MTHPAEGSETGVTFTERFTLYALSLGTTPEALPVDAARGADYINWVQGKWSEFRRYHPEYARSEAQQYHFDAWLAERVTDGAARVRADHLKRATSVVLGASSASWIPCAAPLEEVRPDA